MQARRFVTICEALEGAQTVRLRWPDGPQEGVPVAVAARDRERNLCLVDLPEASMPQGSALTVQRELPPVGSRVYAVSNAAGLGVGISEGVVSGVRSFRGQRYIQFTAPVSPGSEGGALLDAEGRLVGVLDYRHRAGQNVNFAPLAAWVDEVVARSQAAAAQLQRFDAATELLRNARWTELSALSATWVREQPDDADALRFAVAAAAGLKDAPAELAAWRERYRVSPEQPGIGVSLGELLLMRGLADEAKAHAERLVAAQPEFAKAHLLLARTQEVARANREAEASYRRAIELDTWLLEAYQGLARMAQAKGDHETAIAIWSRLSGLFPESLQPRIELARAYMAARRNQRAYAVLQQLPAADQDGSIAWFWRGVALLRLDAPEAAVAAYRKSLERQLEYREEAWRGIGEAMGAMQRWPEAIAAFQAAVDATPSNDGWRYNLAWSLNRGGRAAEALPILSDLTAKSPDEASYWRLLGIVLQRLDRPREAANAMERVLQRAPRDVLAWSELVAMRRAAGLHKEARDAYQQLLALDTKAAADSYRRSMLPFEGTAP
ncbi:hypothetical protein RD110_01425 [Rhodoferax koreense]|uniref:Uncharacterized protein n=1 Tax=Rhodoferax koreensis TaxID=1842727 RepID=A0A1P8JQL6_9BURK|nr:hypothetical protein RD110_01425 [Rhodoferax koreense]